jgi:hypothetical protein
VHVATQIPDHSKSLHSIRWLGNSSRDHWAAETNPVVVRIMDALPHHDAHCLSATEDHRHAAVHVA